MGEEKKPNDRRKFLKTIGKGAVVLGVAGQGCAFVRSLVPEVLYEPERRFKVGTPEQFADGATYFPEHRVFVVRKGKEFSAISAICTHLGCTVKLVTFPKPKEVISGGKPLVEQFEFHCPCHGSKFHGDGHNYAGPAPTPLAWYHVGIAPDDGQLVVDTAKPVPLDSFVRV